MSESAEKRVFFDITIDEQPVGRIEIRLFVDKAPKTCENFRALCTGEAGRTPNNKAHLHYKGNEIHRIVKNFMIQGGDITEGDGRGGFSIFGRYFDDEKFELKHSRPYLLSMANKGPNSNSSQFFITTAPAPHCNGKHVVFGEVIKGKDVVDLIENQEVDDKSKPRAKVSISNCGELVRKMEHQKSEEDSTELDEKQNKEERDRIPEIPKSWLYRSETVKARSRSPLNERRRNSKRTRSNSRDSYSSNKVEINDNSSKYRGRFEKREDDDRIKVRGRGGVRYHHGRSSTPEHWRANAPTMSSK